MKRLIPLLLLAPALASADDCKHEDRRQLAPSLEGVATVRFEVNSHDLRLAGGTDDAPARLDVRACASDPDYLDQLVVETRRQGDTLVVSIERRGQSVGIFFSPTYANLVVDATLPAGLAYEVDVGSGDASVRGVSRLEARVGSGDLDARDITGAMRVSVGSGDVEIDRVGSLDIRSVGSGDVEASRIGGDARIGSVGSGDVELDGVGGSVDVGSIGSGDVDVRDVAGDLVVERVGSGEVRHGGVRGRTSLPSN
ncbi:hypothetical protein [Arenimonas caeni]|uniref:Adhesin domain-containing protein n=1 Tax=Arenimonas caeni TaxID=2058085 RepID=A0A2P6M7Y6_9GAMM|nr:hypothetical protein [Arenimonas caeni]PRH82105.1 hypothetical protein C6N40_08690 [Arenimonas caeni]